MRDRGYLEAHEMAMSFNMLRANELIWSFVVNNTSRQGADALRLLYWNADATRMPAAMHSFYLRNMYHENRLAVPGGIPLLVCRSISKIKVPSFLLSTARITSRRGARRMPNAALRRPGHVRLAASATSRA